MKKKVLYNKDKKKSKAIAVVLAVLFGICTWLYTFREDWKKLLGVITIIIIVSLYAPTISLLCGILCYVYAILDACIKSNEWYINYNKTR